MPCINIEIYQKDKQHLIHSYIGALDIILMFLEKYLSLRKNCNPF